MHIISDDHHTDGVVDGMNELSQSAGFCVIT